jgi:hypothetical protein
MQRLKPRFKPVFKALLFTVMVIMPLLSAKARGLTPTPSSIPTPAGSLIWTDQKLAEYLDQGNRPEAVLIRDLTVSQAGRRLVLYDQTGNEEQRLQLRRRPILVPARALGLGPFTRATRFAVLVDRRHDLNISIGLELFQAGKEKIHKIKRNTITRLYARFKHDPDELTLLEEKGKYELSLPAAKHCGGVRLYCRSGDKRHEIELVFLNRKKPVTIKMHE